MEDTQSEPRPLYRTTGGILIGGHFGRRPPMAFCEEESRRREDSIITSYNKPEILGFPFRGSGSSFTVAPVIAPYSGVLSAEWTGTIPDEGCQFYLVETYEEDIQSSGGGSYLISGVPLNPSAVIVQEAYDFNGPGYLEVPSTWAGGATPGGPVSLAWSLSLVAGIDGRYYLCTSFVNSPPPNKVSNLEPTGGFTPPVLTSFTTLPI